MLNILKKMCEYYEKKKPSNVIGEIHLSIGEDKAFLIDLKEEDVEVERSSKDIEGDLGLTMSEDTFDKLASGEWNGITAAGRSTMSEPAPLDFRLPEGSNLKGDRLQMMYHFLVHFFSSSYPTVTELGRDHSRKVHGGNAVPIAYGHGIRYAYYTIRKGEQINEDELDPWNQVFTVMSGTGTAVIDGEEINLRKDKAVHVPPNVEHIIKKEEGDDDLELLWVAYGEKA